jgi:hypothetical protein
MAFTTKLLLDNGKFYQASNAAIDLSGTTKLGIKAEYLTGMTATPNYKTIVDVGYVTGQTANVHKDIMYLSGQTSGNTKQIKQNLVLFTGYTASTSATIAHAITGVTNGLTCYAAHNACLGGVLSAPVDIDASSTSILIHNINGGLAVTSAGNCLYQCAGINCFTCISTVASGDLCINHTQSSGATGSMCVGADNAGLCYKADYSPRFTDNSLITKKYVCNQTSGITGNYICAAENGLHKRGNNTVSLGGNLTGDTLINENSHQLEICNANNSALILKPNCAELQGSGATIVLNEYGISLNINNPGGVCDCLKISNNGNTVYISSISSAMCYGGNYSGGYVARSIPDVGFVTGCTTGAASDACAYAHSQDAIVSGATLSCAESYADGCDSKWLSSGKTYADGCDTKWLHSAEVYSSGCTCILRKDITYLSGQTDCKQDCIIGGLANQLTYICSNGEEGGTPYMCYYITPNLAFGHANNVSGSTLSAIIGGENNKLSGAFCAVMLGSAGMVATGTTWDDFTIVDCLAIFDGVGSPNKILCVDPATGKVGYTSFSASGAITGGTNGIVICGNCNLGLGGALCADTLICGAGYDLCLGCATSKLDCFCVNAGTTCLVTGSLLIDSSGATFTDLRAGTGRTGILYADNYSAGYVDRSLVDKGYVDSIATGLNPHAAVCVATTGSIALSGLLTIDGFTVANGDRVLVKDQGTASQNGIYDAHATAWTRSSDYDFTPLGEIANGDLIPVLTGNTLLHTVWILTTKNPIVSGNSLTFTEFSQLLGVTAGAGIKLTTFGESQQIAVKLGASGCGLSVAYPDGLCVNSGIAGIGLKYTTGVLDVNAASGGTAQSISVKYDGSNNLVVNCTDIISCVNAITGATNGLTETNHVVLLGGKLCEATTINGQGSQSLTISGISTFNLGFSCGVVTDSSLITPSGLEYADDYSPYYGPNSLVQASFVTGCTCILRNDITYISGCTSKNADDITYISGVTVNNYNAFTGYTASTSGVIATAITGACNGITCSGRHVDLGGTLCCDTNINVSTHCFSICGAPGLPFIEMCDASTFGLGNGHHVYLQGNCQTNIGSSTSNCLTFSFCECGIITDSTLSIPAGLQYASDVYRCHFTDCSLVDKKYVCSQVSGITGCAITDAENGLHKTSGQKVALGGSLTGNTCIDTTALYSLTGGTNAAYILIDPVNAKTVLSSCGGTVLSSCCGTSTAQVCADSYNTCANFSVTDGTVCSCLDMPLGHVQLFGSSGTSWASIDVQPTEIFVSGTLNEFVGAQYSNDYSAQYICLSIPNVGWVTGITSCAITGACNGLTKNIDNSVVLGGTLTGDTLIEILSGDTFRIAASIQDLFILGADFVQLGTTGNSYISISPDAINLTGTINILTTPADGDVTTDYALVWTSTGDTAIKKIAGDLFGEKNNIYSKTIVTGNTTLTSGSTFVILINKTGSTSTITLPTAPLTGQVFKFKDISGQALSYNIIIDAGVGRTIDGSRCALINTDFGALEIMLGAACTWFSMAFIN